jgi:hypothetical protein
VILPYGEALVKGFGYLNDFIVLKKKKIKKRNNKTKLILTNQTVNSMTPRMVKSGIGEGEGVSYVRLSGHSGAQYK